MNKKIFAIASAICCITASLICFSACNHHDGYNGPGSGSGYPKPPVYEHIHNWKTELEYDDNYHWRKCNDSCDIKGGHAVHNFSNDGVCETCRKADMHSCFYTSTSNDGTYCEITELKYCYQGNMIVPAAMGETPVTVIAARAFRNRKEIISAEIPSSVRTIGASAFSGCTSLTAITYKGTKAQWNEVNKTSWNSGSSITTVHCTDGDIVL